MARKTTFPSFYGDNELKSWNPGPESQLFIPAPINVYHFSQKKKKAGGGVREREAKEGERERNKCCSPNSVSTGCCQSCYSLLTWV